MHRRYGTWVVIAGLAGACGLGACFMSDNEATNDPVGGAGGTGPTATSTGAAAGGGSAVGGGPPTGDRGPRHERQPSIDGAGGNDWAEIPEACEELAAEPRSTLLLYLSADDSSSMASPALAREQLMASQAPTHIRPQEFRNYYRILYPDTAPTPSEPLAVFAHGEQLDDQGWHELQIGVRSFDAFSPRRAMTLTFVLDTSGSMSGGAMDRLRAVITAVAGHLQAQDVVNIVTWDTDDAIVLGGYHVPAPPDPPDTPDATVLTTAAELEADGGSDLYSGLVAGYALAGEYQKADGLNRVILISDGGINIGVTEETLIASLAADGEAQGIHLLGVGTGPAEDYDDQLMRKVTGPAGGSYVYLDTVLEASHLFSERFDEVMEVAARAVRVEVTLPWYFEANAGSGEELTTTPDSFVSADLAPGDTLLFDQIISPCHPDALEQDERIHVVVHWEHPLDAADDSTDIEIRLSELVAQDQAPLRKARAITAYAWALEMGTADALQEALEVVETARAADDDDELDEIADLIQLHPEFPQQR